MHRSKVAPHLRRAAAFALAAVLALSLIGCSQPAEEEAATPATEPVETSEIVLASTTSTQDSGLFDVLIPAFESANPEYAVKVVAVGTGEALKLGETKDADVLLVHAKADEEKLVANGFGVERRDVMYNDFILVGPEADPAGVKNAADIAAAMAAVAEGKAPFISRGDDSGTHKKELKIWATAKIDTPTPDADDWYESAGQGMGDTLKIASEKAGYTLADRATYLSMKDALDLVIVREGDEDLLNQYGVIVVTEARNQAGGQAFFDWVLSAEGQEVIKGYGVEEYGQPLFIPNAQ
jgi:tungstate transport system substrate-binding protein